MPPTVGVDIAEVTRIARLVEEHGERFLNRVYTDGEIGYCRGRLPELAARFAAKEAVLKALGTGLQGIGWHEIEVLPDALGKPVVRLSGRAQARARALGLAHFAISLSHTREYAVAFVVASGP